MNQVDQSQPRLSFGAIQAMIILVVSTGIAATDLYVPSFPSMARDLAVSHEAVQSTVGFFFWGVVLSAPIYGILSDMHGRRIILMIGLGIFTFFSFLAPMTDSITTLLICRFFQGIGSGVTGVVPLALQTEMLTPEENAKMMSTNGAIIALTPALAPALGGVIEVHYGWRMSFWVIFALCVASLAMSAAKAVETNFTPNRTPLFKQLREMFGMLKSRNFLSANLMIAGIFGAAWGYIVVSSVLFQRHYNVDPDTYGLFSTLIVSGYVFGSLINRKLIARFGIHSCLKLGLSFTVLASVLHILNGLSGTEGAWSVAGTQLIYIFGMAFIFGPGMALAMECFPNNRGAAASFVSFFRNVSAALGAGMGFLVRESTILDMGIACLLLTIMSILALRAYRSKKV